MMLQDDGHGWRDRHAGACPGVLSYTLIALRPLRASAFQKDGVCWKRVAPRYIRKFEVAEIHVFESPEAQANAKKFRGQSSSLLILVPPHVVLSVTQPYVAHAEREVDHC